MGIVIDYWLEAGLGKAESLDRQLSEAWSESTVKEKLDGMYPFQHEEGDQVETEDGEVYEILDTQPVHTFLNGEESYTADRLFENPDGELSRSYDTQTIRGGQLP